MPDESENLSVSPAAVSHVSVKILPFYTKNPGVWFRQMESQFHLAKVTSPETKFHHILSALPEEIAANLPIDDDMTYEALKKAVLDSLTANKHQLIEQALSAVELGNKRPTQLVVEIKRRFAEIGLTPDEAIIKSRILSALPANIKSALVGHDSASLEDYVKIADSMLAVAAPVNPYSIDAVSDRGNSNNNSNFSRQSDNVSSNRFHNNHRANNGNRGRQNYYGGIRPFHNDQRPRICNAHIFYASHARTCRHWCKWPNKPKKVLQEGEKTPSQSRASSPVN